MQKQWLVFLFAMAAVLGACSGGKTTLPSVPAVPNQISRDRAMSGGLTPSYVQGANLVSTAKATSLTPTLSATPAANDVLVACVSTEDSNTISTPTGWTKVGSISNHGAIALYAFYRYAAGSSPSSFTFTASGSDWMSANIREYSGIDTTTALAGSNSAISPGSGNISGAESVAATPSVSGTLPVSCFVSNSAMGVTAHTTGATENLSAYPSTQSGNGFISPYNGDEAQTGPIQTGTTAYTASATWNVTANNGPGSAEYLLMLNPPPAATPSPPPGPVGYVQGAAVSSSSQTSSVSPTLTATPVPNDLLVACASTEDSNTISTPTGWTKIGSVSNHGAIILYTFYRYVPISSPTSFTFTSSAADWMSASVREYAGVNSTTALAGSASAISPGAGNISGTEMVSGSPSSSGALPVSCFVTNSAMGVTAHTASATENYSGFPSSQSGNGFVSPYNGNEGQTGPILSGTGSYSATATWNVTANNGPGSAQYLLFLNPQSTASNPTVVKVWLGAPWPGTAANGQYGCADPSWTSPSGNVGTNFAALNNLVFLVADNCTSAYAAYHSTAPNIKTMTYFDPHRICDPYSSSCDENPNITALNSSTDLMQCPTGPLVSPYAPSVTTAFGDPSSSGLQSATNTGVAGVGSLDIAWLDDAMMAEEEYWSGSASPCTPTSNWSNISYGSSTAYTATNWVSSMEAFDNAISKPVVNEGLCNGSGADLSAFGDALASGDAHDPSPATLIVTGSTNTWGAICENYGQGWNDGENQINGKSVDGGSGSPPIYQYMWSTQANTALEVTAANKYFIGWPYLNMGTGGSTQDRRGYIYSSAMLVYDPNYTIVNFSEGNYNSGSYAPLEPEMGLVPTVPRVTLRWPSRVSTIQNGGLYIREYTNCTYFGHSVGNCAFVVNPSPSSAYSLPTLSGTYNYSVGLNAGQGIFNGQWGQPNYGDATNDITFNNSISSSIAAVGWEILIQNIPTGGP